MFEGKEALFEYMLTREDVFASFQVLVSGMKLSSGEREMVRWAKEFRQKYKRMPILKELEIKIGSVKLYEGADDKVMYHETVDFVRNEKVKEWIISIAEKLDYGGVRVEDLFDNAKRLVEDFAGREFRVRTFEDMSLAAIERILSPELGERVPTGIKSLDKVLFGGIGKGEFLCMIAPPGRGKTMSLINLSYGALVARKKVLFISLELSEDQILGRFVRRVSRQSRKDIRIDVKKTKDMVHRFQGVAGDLVVMYHRPHTLTVQELGVIADRVRRQCGGLDAIVIDYFDRMALPHRDARLGYGYLVDYLRDMGSEHDLAILSATQANRASLSALIVTEEHVGESYKKIENSDIVMSLNRSQADIQKNAGRIVMLKNREWGNAGAQVPVSINFDQSFIGDFGV